MKKVNIGGVPEHFNVAWYLTQKNEAYKKEGIELNWKNYHGGTGAMCKALREDEIDIAVILTEGITKDIIEGNPSKIVQTYVQTPLVWGIHVAHHAPYNTIEDIKGTKAAISRYGSGSHLMAYINAKNNAWDLKTDLQFEVIKNLEGAVEGLNNNTADYFMWEKFTTKPLVDNQIFKRVGDCPSPWPCFVIAVTNTFIEQHEAELKTILNIINAMTRQLKSLTDIEKTIAYRYEQKLDDVKDWLKITEWSQELIDEPTLMNVQQQLKALDIIPKIVDYNTLTHKLK